MKAEIIAVGSELLLGDVINSNATWISRQLAALGVDVYYHQTVGDNPARIQGVVQQAAARAELLIFTGGLGPTDDDLTISALADYFQTPLVSDAQSQTIIEARFRARKIPMSPSNLKQALRPESAEVIPNPVGTAPGIAWDVSPLAGKPLFLLTFPGVPKELYAMWPAATDWIRQWQQTLGETNQVLLTRYLHFFGLGESRLGEMLSDLMGADNPTVAPYVGKSEVKIRIAAKAPSLALAEQAIAPIEAEIIRRCGPYYIGATPNPDPAPQEASFEQAVAHRLIHLGYTLSVAESCTGGLISSRLTDVPGSSAYTTINLVTYSNAEKTRLLGVQPQTLQAVGAVSAEVAQEMAQGIRHISGSTQGLAITGIAGPGGGSLEKPVGLAYIGLAGYPTATDVQVQKVLVNPQASRQEIKYAFSQHALQQVLQALQTLESTPGSAGFGA